MKKTLQLINNFEKRNNIAVALIIFGDGSSSVEEFWSEEVLNESNTVDELHHFLNNTQYRLNEDGICICPIQVI